MGDQSKACPLCGVLESERLFDSHNGFPVRRCLSCHLVYVDDRGAPAPETLYPAFEQSSGSAFKALRKSINLFLRQRAAFVRSIKAGGRLLDFGCGSGAFARHMSESGFESVGLEPFSLGEPERTGRLQLIRGPLEEAAPKLGKFDVITMWHVLEHLSAPLPPLKILRGLLAPGGALVVSVPNFASWQSRLFRGSWFHLDAPRHILMFEPETLANCLSRAGYQVCAEQRFMPEYGSSGWIQSALNQVLPHSNFVYELVKDRGALSSMRPAVFWGHLAGSVVGGAPLFALSFPVEALASLSNQAAALTYAARVA